MSAATGHFLMYGKEGAEPHVYLSTGCLHGRHDYCQESVKEDGGTKAPAECKFCAAPCICDCHQQAAE